MTLLTQLILLM